MLVGASGGTVAIEGAVEVQVPPGALAQALTLTVQEAPVEPPIPSGALSAVYAFGPAGLDPLEPLTVRFPLADERVTQAVVFWSTPALDGWDRLEARVVDGVAEVEVEHFSVGFVAAYDVTQWPVWHLCLVQSCTPSGGCKSDADCASLSAGNLCNGTYYCNQNKGACDIKLGSSVYCSTYDDTVCSKNQCVPATGACEEVPVNEGGPCDDGKPCTAPDQCKAGVCAPGALVCECLTSADCASKEDGDLCNGTLYCNPENATCKVNPASVVKCASDKDTPCQKSSCQSATGKCEMVPINEGGPCEDGPKCTFPDTCQLGLCVSGKKSCECETNADCVAKEDGDLCNGTLFCNKALQKCFVNESTIKTCPTVDDTGCRKNLCQPATGVCVLTPVNEGVPCDDGNFCTAPDQCKGGACKGPLVCQCTDDPGCAEHEDGNLCNGTLFCNKSAGKCEVNPATLKTCPTVNDTECTKNQCQPESGACLMTELPIGSPCDDGNHCTKPDLCDAGACEGPDTCQCQKDADCAAFEDGDLCNGTLYCDKANGECIVNPATVKTCSAVNDTLCLYNECQPSTGICAMTPVPDWVINCEDGHPCTGPDYCVAGSCFPGGFEQNAQCHCDQNDDCDPYESPNKCFGTWYCDMGGLPWTCKHDETSPPNCDDNNECTFDVCQPEDGSCTHTNYGTETICGQDMLCDGAGKCVPK